MPRFKARLMTRTLVMVSGALLVFIAILSLSLVFGTGQLLRTWEARENAGLRNYLETRLRDLAVKAEKAGRSAEPAEVAAALADFPYDPDWIVVQSPDNLLLYFFRREGTQTGQSRNFLRRLQDIDDWGEIRSGGDRVAFKYSSRVPSFSERESNRLLLAALGLVLVTGSVVASLIAFVVAYGLARPVARHAERLAASLEAIGTGRRDVPLEGESISELDRIAQAAARLQANLIREEALRRQWAADIAHDLRTPITVLKGQLEALTDGVLPATPERLARCTRETERLERLVNDLGLLTRLEAPDFHPEIRDMGTRPILEELSRRFQDTAGRKATSISVEGEDLPFRADPALLERALANIVDNALRYGKADGGILLTAAAAQGGGVDIAVRNGGLIPADQRAFVFDRLFRGDGARGSAGSGLGLAIAKAVADAHGADLTLACDEVACTTTFRLRFT